MDNQNESYDDSAADVESVIERDNSIKDPESAEKQDANATPNVPGLIRPTLKSKRHPQMVVVTVNAMEMRRNTGIMKNLERMSQYVSPASLGKLMESFI